MPQGSPKAGEFYLHFKKKLYQVLTIATHSETREQLVIYQALYGNYGVYARPYDMFISEVDHVKYPEVKEKYRFTFLTPKDLAELTGDALQERSEGRSEEKPEENTEVNTEEKAEETSEEKPEEKAKVRSEETEEGSDPSDESFGVDPLLLEFLDEENFGKKYKILEEMEEEGSINDTLIDNMAASIDVVIPDGPVDDRFSHLKYAVSKRMQFETERFRR
ncbi:MAG: DUF1653 domain-containing protein [Lachnospiraceae bacterium]|nr:DUF1653 domain-containing protein [Lachnospiraceae bacterium]MDD6578295.1 DUF1653 domain-containing protein [Lachnospiraceae bacterium]